MSVNYEEIAKKLMESEPEITALAVIEGKDKIVYTTDTWEIKDDLKNIFEVWQSKYIQYITIYDIKYSVLQATPERLVATSIKGVGHIVGAQDQDEDRILISFVESHGNMLSSYVATARALSLMSAKIPYLDEDAELGISEEDAIKKELISHWDKPKLRAELMRGLIEFFDKGAKLEKPDQKDLKRLELERQRRMNEVHQVLQALEITKEKRTINVSLYAEFEADFIYDDFAFLHIKHRIEDLLREAFNIDGPFKVEIVKKI